MYDTYKKNLKMESFTNMLSKGRAFYANWEITGMSDLTRAPALVGCDASFTSLLLLRCTSEGALSAEFKTFTFYLLHVICY